MLYTVIPAVLFLSFLSTTKAAPGGMALAELHDRVPLAAHVGKLQKEAVGEIIFLPEGSFDAYEAAEMIETVAELPAPLLNRVKESGIKIRLFEGRLTDNPSARHLKGKVPRGYAGGATWDSVPGIGGSEIVLVKIGASGKGSGHGSVNLELHELAHSIDALVYSNVSARKDFLKIWKEERDDLFGSRTYFLTYAEEYFAEVFAYYYYSEGTRRVLKERAPKTYTFIKKLQ